MTNKIAKFGAAFAGVAMALSFATPAGAVTVAELQAQITALMAQLSALGGGSSVSTTFTTDLTIGSTGSQVSALQSWLVSRGFLTMPAGVAMGYFGNLTKAAVAAWQASAGISPAAGYFGPKSRAALASAGGVTTGGTTTGGTTTGTTGITTPGVEGTMTVTSAPVSTGTLYEGDMMKDVLAFKVKAQNSDIAVQRVKLNLGTATTIYNKIYQKVYVVNDAGQVLASSDLNSSTVVKDGNNYYITLAGFSYVVPKDSTKTISLKADVRPSIDSTDIDTETYTITLADNGVRGTDGAGIDQYSPTTGSSITKTISFSGSLTDSASLTLSTNSNNPLSQEVIAADGANNNELDKATLLTFDIKADKDDVLLTDLVATVNKSIAATNAVTASSTFLYADGNVIGTASLSGATATFNDINFSIPKDTTKTFTLKVDIRGATAVQGDFTASVANSGLTGENTIGDNVSKTGSATSNHLYVRSVGPIFTLVGTPTIVKGALPVQNNYATSTAAATFNLHIKAVGASILFGSNASTTYPMVSNGTGAPARSFITYLGGASNNPSVSSSTDFAVPSSGVVNDSTNATFTLQEDQEITIPVTFTIQGNTTAGVGVTYGSYSIGLERINWLPANGSQSSSTFMSSQTNWRTGSVTLP